MESILLAQRLEHLVRTKRNPQSVLFVPKAFAAVLNAVGGYVLVQTTAQKVVERMNNSTPSPQPR